MRARQLTYRARYLPKHPCANKRGYVRKSRLVMEGIVGRFLDPTEDVHHIDGNTENNEPSNLQLLTKSEHRRVHQGWKRIDGQWFKVCRGCNRFLQVVVPIFLHRISHGTPGAFRPRCHQCELAEKVNHRRIQKAQQLKEAA